MNCQHWLIAVGFALAVSPAAADELIGGCESCHGAGGASIHADMPIIGGLSANYLREALRAYRAGERPCHEVAVPDRPEAPKTDMCRASKPLSDAQIDRLAAHFSARPFVPARQPFDAALAARGRKVHDYLCEKCHYDGGADPADDAGILSGQWAPFLELTFHDYAQGRRSMPDKMRIKYEKLSADDIKALIQYYASRKP